MSLLCALSNDWPIIDWVPKFYHVLLFDKGKCQMGLMGALGRCKWENEKLVCTGMFEADEDKPKHCNLASMLYDLGLIFPSCRTLHRDIYSTTVLSYMKLHNAWLLKTSSKKSDNGFW